MTKRGPPLSPEHASIPDCFEDKIARPLTDEQRADLLARAATCLKELGREKASRAAVKEALALDSDCARARELW